MPGTVDLHVREQHNLESDRKRCYIHVRFKFVLICRNHFALSERFENQISSFDGMVREKLKINIRWVGGVDVSEKKEDGEGWVISYISLILHQV